MTTIEEQEEVPIGQVVREFAAHVLGGTAMFLVIAMPAVGCDLLLKWLHAIGISYAIFVLLQVLKFILLAVDVGFFCLFLGASAKEPIRRCIKRLNQRGTWR